MELNIKFAQVTDVIYNASVIWNIIYFQDYEWNNFLWAM